ncbi:hypothetical protein [Novosphingobium sp. PP1Y]|uniref:hypothetical protein n=1 Tax=Novosphingobium sp. PP1Y TaxID=702113 RepID=UPI0005A0E906|nr:hypothetical protein [Novosphingobium sp. PP1Y]
MTEPAGAGQAFPRGFLRVAGVSVAHHQLGLALALDCQRVICMARGTSPELLALQHAAEDAGLQFYIATNLRQLSGLITASDEVLVVTEGLFVDPGSVTHLFESRGPVVLVMPVENALAAGFERIDLNRAAAGIMRVPGELMERLQELPPDCDMISALTRIALQSGIAMREVPSGVRIGANWRLVRNEGEAVAVEAEWLAEQVSDGRQLSPGGSVARLGVLTFGTSLLQAGNASNMLSLGALVSVGLSAVLGWFGLVWIALIFAAIAALLVESSRLLRQAERRARGQMRPIIPRADALGWLVDIEIGLLSLAALPRVAGESLISWAFPPIMLVLLVALIPNNLTGSTASWFRDRALLGVILALSALFGHVQIVVELISIGLVLAGLILPLRRKD